jgi:hypothetical protein
VCVEERRIAKVQVYIQTGRVRIDSGRRWREGEGERERERKGGFDRHHSREI